MGGGAIGRLCVERSRFAEEVSRLMLDCESDGDHGKCGDDAVVRAIYQVPDVVPRNGDGALGLDVQRCAFHGPPRDDARAVPMAG